MSENRKMENLKYSEILQQNRILSQKDSGTTVKVTVLANVTTNAIKELLEYQLRINNINPIVTFGSFDTIVQDSMNCKDSDLVIVFYDMLTIVNGLSDFFESLPDEFCTSLKDKIYSEIDIIFDHLKDCPSVIFNAFSSASFVSSFAFKSNLDVFVTDLNNYIAKKTQNNVSLIFIDKIIIQLGINQAVDFRLFHSSKAPYTIAFFKKYVLAIEPIILRNTGKLKKALLFDCDNTLWKGVMGEQGAENIEMSNQSKDGSIFKKIQQIAVYLSNRGIIIGICSKNNEHDIIDIFTNHPDISLKNEHIIINKINWDDKANNLREIAIELNIGLDSIVFVDDSSFEINLIKEQLPEIVCFQVPNNLTEYPNSLLKLIYRYFNVSINQDDIQKTKIYKQQFLRENVRNNFKSIDEYLATLGITVTIYRNEKSQIARISQLTQKSNQFNLTTKRYTENQIEYFMESSTHEVFSASVNDKFGDNGLTLICIINTDLANKTKATIDTLLMSCRIIGRNIEFIFMDFLIQWLINHTYKRLIAAYIPTNKNAQVEQFYDKLGFTVIESNIDTKNYSLNLSDYIFKKIDYIATNFDQKN